jgi:L-alanine-DL-glutamate epimerase-like enolase superfamily enzyme
MKIEAIDFFYLSMPKVTTEADGSQDALLVKVAAGGLVGFGECEAAPLPSIAALVCPLSHGSCQPVQDSVLGQNLNNPADIQRISQLVAYQSMDLLQAAHTFSGIEMALWDLFGKSMNEPVWKLLGYQENFAKTPYFSVLFGEDPAITFERAREARHKGFQAAKFGWGPIGLGTSSDDRDHFQAAREGLGKEGILLVDTGQIFGDDVEKAAQRIGAMEEANVLWFEEPFHAYALKEYGELAKRSGKIKLAGGEGAHHPSMAKHLIDFGKVGYIQIDCGRIGGIGPAKVVADHALAHGVTYVNHTFTSHLALSASLQPYAGLKSHEICEYPGQPKSLALDITKSHLELDPNSQIKAPEAPGLGMEINLDALNSYLVDVSIQVNGKQIFYTPSL